MTKYLFCTVVSFLISNIAILAQSNKISVQFEKITTFGKADGNMDEMIGIVSDISVDKKNNVYVLDNSFKIVKKFAPDGKFLMVFGKGHGQGPGEFTEARSISVDDWGNVYVADKKLNRITIFDKQNNVLRSFNTNYKPAYIEAFSMGEFYVVGFKGDNNDKSIKKYNMNADVNNPVHMFGDTYKGDNEFEINHSGYVDKILKINNGKKIVKFDFYPYSIQIFDLNGNKLNSLFRKVPFYRAPIKVRSEPLYIKALSGGLNLCKISPDIIVAQIFVIKEESNIPFMYFDFWDIKKGVFVGSFTAKELGIPESLRIYGTEDGFFYVVEMEPYPNISKYKIKISFK